jgi:phospholipid/cholesterol/gamma-HCH transport system substrate-binding protein
MADREQEPVAPPVSPVRDQALWVGLFLIVALAATLGLLFTLTDAALFRGRYVVSTEVRDAGGIRRGDPVQMRGVNIGRVMAFEISQRGVRIRLEIEGEYPIPADSKVHLKSAGMLGGMVAEVVPGSAERRLRYGDTVAGSAEEPVMSAAQRLMDQAGGAIGRADKLLSDKLIGDLHESGAELRALLKSLSETVVEQRQELKLLEASLRRNSEGLEKTLAGPDLERATKRLDEITERASRVASSLERSAKSAEEVMGRLERGEGTLGKLTRDDALYKDASGAVKSLQQAANELSTLVADVRKNPKRYLKFSVF